MQTSFVGLLCPTHGEHRSHQLLWHQLGPEPRRRYPWEFFIHWKKSDDDFAVVCKIKRGAMWENICNYKYKRNRSLKQIFSSDFRKYFKFNEGPNVYVTRNVATLD